MCIRMEDCISLEAQAYSLLLLLPCTRKPDFRYPQPIPILTDVYVYDPQFRTRLEDYITKIFEYIKKYQILMPSNDVYLVLEFRQSGRCGYYFVDHETKCLFWLEKYDAMEFLSQVRVRYTPSLVGQWFYRLIKPQLNSLD